MLSERKIGRKREMGKWSDKWIGRKPSETQLRDYRYFCLCCGNNKLSNQLVRIADAVLFLDKMTGS